MGAARRGGLGTRPEIGDGARPCLAGRALTPSTGVFAITQRDLCSRSIAHPVSERLVSAPSQQHISGVGVAEKARTMRWSQASVVFGVSASAQPQETQCGAEATGEGRAVIQCRAAPSAPSGDVHPGLNECFDRADLVKFCGQVKRVAVNGFPQSNICTCGQQNPPHSGVMAAEDRTTNPCKSGMYVMDRLFLTRASRLIGYVLAK